MRVFYDFEFYEDGQQICPISVALVRQDTRAGTIPQSTYYAVFEEIDQEPLNTLIEKHRWLMDNVVPSLPLREDKDGIWSFEGNRHFTLSAISTAIRPRRLISREVRKFLADTHELDPSGSLDLWADCPAYDHVALMQLCYGPMSAKPSWMPWTTYDLRQLDQMIGGADIDGADIDQAPPTLASTTGLGPHHALYDALYHQDQYEYITREWER